MKIEFESLQEIIGTLEQMAMFLDNRIDYLSSMDLMKSYKTHLDLYQIIQNALDEWYEGELNK